MKGEELAQPRLRIASVRKAGDAACAFVNEWQRFLVIDPFQFGRRVARGLILDRVDLMAPPLRLRLDDTDSALVEKNT